MVKAQAHMDIKNTPPTVPMTVRKIEIPNPVNRLLCLKTSLKFSSEKTLGQNQIPPEVASRPELKAEPKYA